MSALILDLRPRLSKRPSVGDQAELRLACDNAIMPLCYLTPEDWDIMVRQNARLVAIRRVSEHEDWLSMRLRERIRKLPGPSAPGRYWCTP